MHKLKTALRSSHRKRDSTSSQSPRQSFDSSEPASPRVDHHTTSSRQNGRSSLDAYQGRSQQGRRSRPVSAAYDDRRGSNASAQHYVPTGIPIGLAHTTPSDSVNGSIANDYRSYLPALSPVDDVNGDSYMTLGGDRPLTTGENDRLQGEDRYRSSIDASRNKPLPVPPNPMNVTHQQPRHSPAGAQTHDSTIRVVPSATSAEKYRDAPTTRSGLVDGNRPHQEMPGSSKDSWKKNGYAAQSAPDDSQLGRNRRVPQVSGSNNDRPRPPPEESLARRDIAVQPAQNSTHQSNAVGGHHAGNGLQDWKTQQKSLLDRVVDLRNTVDADKDIQVAAPVVHELIKPHEHEVIQRKIYREIHNYSNYHRLQPVMHTEVLPPRHFIPNPDGEGLIEISADELPMRTGKNRWWEIMQKELPQTYEIQSRWRTEPEIIEGEPYITEEGFERRETTIIYPPELEDMSGYDGAVQLVHFDHKTGERWLGEVTTMAKVREQRDHDMLTMKGLTESLPDVPPSPSVRRKPVGARTVL